MVKTRLKQSFVFILITAFLSLQWSSAHIHLAEHHEHDGGQHQHAATTHNHHLSNHSDVIDSVSITHVTELLLHESHTVIELEQLCTLFHSKHIDQSPCIINLISTLFNQAYGNEPDVKSVTYFSFNSYLETTSIRLRAPPLFS